MKSDSFLKVVRFKRPILLSGSALLFAASLFTGLALRAERSKVEVKLPATPSDQASASAQRIEFNQDVEPIFQAACNKCHGAENPQARLRLDSEAAAFEGGVSGKVVVPGKSGDSLLAKRLFGADNRPRMPLGAPPLPEEQINTIRAWIDSLASQANGTRASQAAIAPRAAHAEATAGQPAAPPFRAAPAGLKPAATGEKKIEYATQVQPIFDANCTLCHGPNVQQNQLRLDSLGLALKGSISGPVIVPGNGKNSKLVRRLMGLDDPRMPFNRPPLSPDQIALIRGWIDQGAPGAEEVAGRELKAQVHWAYIKPVRPDLPKVKNAAWCRNSIDYFVLARLERGGLAPSPEAEKETLIRRVGLDLIGLPPTPQEVEAFQADKSPDAYEKVVDRLLASPHYGERWARPWLDLARYADSHGFEADPLRVAWKWRDWVIQALNQDMSFKVFTIEQIAGDMLPNATTEQKIATGFHRNTMLNKEGGVDREEYRWYSLLDRVNTTAAVWLGTSLECAQCHNHKFDPFSQKDYYQFLAFFDNAEYKVLNLGQGEGYVQEPEIELPTPEQEAKSQTLRAEVDKVRAVLNTQTPELDAAQEKWEIGMKGADAIWTAVQPSHLESLGGAALKLLDDQSVLASGKNPEADTYIVQAKTNLAKITGIRLEVMNDASLPHGGPGRDPEGNFVLTEIEISVAPADKPEALEKVVVKEAFANESQDGYDIYNLIKKGMWGTGWAIDTSPATMPLHRQAVLVPEKPLGFGHGSLVTLRLKHNMRHATHNIGRFRLSVTSLPDPETITRIPARLLPVLDIPVAKRSKEQKDSLAAVFRSATPLLKPQRDRLAELQKELDKLGIATAMIMRERESFERPSTYIHIRGSYLAKGEKVYADVPAALHPLPSDVMPNRLGLAYWLVDENNPLTARVEVNRIWETIFGRGIVETSENFGTQGSPPTHPELLDWLATEFMRQGWCMKKLIRLIVTSSTYRQSARATPELLERDPYNRLLARGPRFGVEAEMVRDISLAASGLLSPKIGGPSVFPYQPEGIWDRPYSEDKWVVNEGEDRYRRGIYTFIRRTAPYPSLTVFDAPSREFCTVRRVRTNTPLQALTALNDPAFFEAARALAKRVMKEAGPDDAARIAYGFRLTVTRRPTADELKYTLAFYNQELEHFQKDAKAAREVIQAGDKSPPDAAQVAAWTMVSNVLLNLDETITKE